MPQKLSSTTTDHDTIRRWVEERGGWPAEVEATGREGETGIIRIDFPGFSGDGSLRRISWDEWFQKFDDAGLALVYEETTAGGERSNFNKLIARETAAARTRGQRTSRGGAAGKKRAAVSARGAGASAKRAGGARRGSSGAQATRRSGGRRQAAGAGAGRATSRKRGASAGTRPRAGASGRSTSRTGGRSTRGGRKGGSRGRSR